MILTSLRSGGRVSVEFGPDRRAVPTPPNPEFYCIIDTETNGLPDADPRVSAIEVAAVIIDGRGEVVAAASNVIAPASWPDADQVDEAEAVHGLARSWVEAVGEPALGPRSFPSRNAVGRFLLPWLAASRVLAWNAEFDSEILTRTRTPLTAFASPEPWRHMVASGGAAEFNGRTLPVQGCLRSLAAELLGSPDPTVQPPLLGDGRRASLARVAERLDVPPSPGAHRALTDALQTAAVARAMVRHIDAVEAEAIRG